MRRCTFFLTLLLLPQLAFASGNYTWTQRTGAGSQYWGGVGISNDGTKIIAGAEFTPSFALGGVYTSSNSGSSWAVQSSLGSDYWGSAVMSSSGSVMAISSAAGSGKNVLVSTNGGSS